MTVFFVPKRLRVATTLLFSCIPLIGIEVVIASRSPLWKIPYRSIEYWCLAFFLISVPLVVWMNAAKKWALNLTIALIAVWIVISAWIAIRLKYPALGFFTLFLLFFFSLELLWLWYEMKRSFFDPRVTWYQAFPKPIPGLKCEMATGDKTLALRVSRIDKEGAFVYSDLAKAKPFALNSDAINQKRIELIFSFRDRQVTCQGKPALMIEEGAGAGIQFFGASSDLRKDVGDFVEVLRGEGYV